MATSRGYRRKASIRERIRMEAYKIGKADVKYEDERFRAGYFGFTFDLHIGAQLARQAE